MQETKPFGIHVGTKLTACVLVNIGIYMALMLVISLSIRLGLQMYYTTAHLCCLSTIIAIFLFSHHTGRTRAMSGWSRKAFRPLQILLNLLYFGLCLAIAVGYTAAYVMCAHANYDYIFAFVFAYINTLCMLYLLVLSHSAETRKPVRDIDVYTYEDCDLQLRPLDLNGSIVHLHPPPEPEKPSKARTCCVRVFYVVFTFMYIITQICLLLMFLLSAYQALASVRDFALYRENDTGVFSVSVELPGHNAYNIYYQCAGKGEVAILFENDAGLNMMDIWKHVNHLSLLNVTVCVYDRHGYGWSDTHENDVPGAECSFSDTDFLAALTQIIGLKKPFYYMGYGYGTERVIRMAHDHPDYIKGIILLDPTYKPKTSTIDLGLITNFSPTGIIRFLEETYWFDVRRRLLGEETFYEINTSKQRWAYENTWYYYKSFYRELLWSQDNRAQCGEQPKEDYLQVPHPVLIIGNSENRDTLKIPALASYDPSSDYHWIPRSTHTSLIFSPSNMTLVTYLVNHFIEPIEHMIDKT